jgi:hypothetical protein
VVLADTGAKALSKLRQVYSGTVITEAHGAVMFDRSKVEYIQRTFTGKTAILYTFNAEGDMLKSAYSGRWTDSPEVFNADPAMTFIGQVRSSREGVNLSTADDLVFFGIDYAALSYIQGRDRASYLGRDRENRVHWILADDGIETRVWELVQGKNDYTLKHFQNDRARYSGPDHEAATGGGVLRDQGGAGDRGGLAGSNSDEAQRVPVHRGEEAGQEAQPHTGVPTQRAAQLGLFGGGA